MRQHLTTCSALPDRIQGQAHTRQTSCSQPRDRLQSLPRLCLGLGADLIATGHLHCVAAIIDGRTELLKGLDPNKADFFLHAVGEQIARTLFPGWRELLEAAGTRHRREVRAGTAKKKDSLASASSVSVASVTFSDSTCRPRPGDIETTEGGSSAAITA